MEFTAVWHTGQLTGVNAAELARFVTAATPPGARRHIEHTTYITLLEDTAGNLDVHTASRLHRAAGGPSHEPEWAAAITGAWGHRWNPDTVAAVLAAEPERAHAVYLELGSRTTPDTPQVLTDAAATTIGLLRWIERVPGAARAMYRDTATLTVDEWHTMWQLLINEFHGTGRELVEIARATT